MTTPPVRVLLVDDDPDYPVLMRDLLGDVEDTHYDVDWAATYKTAEERIRRGGYDVYLVDYRLGEFTGLDLLRGVLEHGRRGPVVILTGQATRELDLEAMQAGAVDFLIKGQFSSSDLERSIRYAIIRHGETPPAAAATPSGPAAAPTRRMISFVGAKGGVGTTTVALNVAMSLAKQGQRPLALDLRPHYGHLGTMVTPVLRHDLGDLIRHPPRDINEAAMRRCVGSHLTGLEVLASPQLAHKYRPITPEMARAVVDTAYQMSNVTVVDLPADGSLSNREALWRSTVVALVLERDPASIAGAERTLELLNSWGIRKAVGLIFVEKGPAYPTGVADLAQRFERGVFAIIPAATTPLIDAAGRGLPLVLAAPAHEASKALTDLAGRVSAETVRPLAL